MLDSTRLLCGQSYSIPSACIDALIQSHERSGARAQYGARSCSDDLPSDDARCITLQELLEAAMVRMTALRRSDAPGSGTGPPADGSCGVLVLEAGLGLGKTRVLEELATRARGAGMLVLSGRGDKAKTGQVSTCTTCTFPTR